MNAMHFVNKTTNIRRTMSKLRETKDENGQSHSAQCYTFKYADSEEVL